MTKKIANVLGAILGVALFTFMAIGGWSAYKEFGLGSSELAGWVQAVGGFAAIVFSGSVARMQLSEARKQDAERLLREEAQKVNTVHVLIRPILEIANHVQGNFEKTVRLAILDVWLDNFMDYKKILGDLPYSRYLTRN